MHADAKPGYDNVSYYAIQITASKLLDKECEYKVIRDPLNSVISNDLDWPLTQVWRYFTKVNVSKWCILYCATADNSFT